MYGEAQLNKIREHIRDHGYATNNTEPTWHLISTVCLFLGVLYAIHVFPLGTSSHRSLRNGGYLLFGALILLLALLNMRLFMIFHDLVHKSFYPTDERARKYNGFNFQMASVIELWTSFSANYWNKIHSTHHGALGDIDAYDGTRTVMISSEYEKLPDFAKCLYRIGRYPLLFFTVVPIYVYWLNRVISGDWFMFAKYLLWLALLFKIGSWKLMLSFMAAQYIAGVFGIMLFHLQHQCNEGYWKHDVLGDEVKMGNAALLGSTVLQMPWWLEYFSNGIEYHNIHHIDAGIPSYNMKRVHGELVAAGLLKDDKVDYSHAWEGLWNTFYDEKTERYMYLPPF